MSTRARFEDFFFMKRKAFVRRKKKRYKEIFKAIINYMRGERREEWGVKKHKKQPHKKIRYKIPREPTTMKKIFEKNWVFFHRFVIHIQQISHPLSTINLLFSLLFIFFMFFSCFVEKSEENDDEKKKIRLKIFMKGNEKRKNMKNNWKMMTTRTCWSCME